MSKRKVSLANKYRPATFSDMSEQASIKTILENQIKNNKLKGAYLFTGSAGVGKTSAARIIAGMMNEHKGRPIEMDCASHNGIEDMRKIIDDCRSRPIGTKYKIFILDECMTPDTEILTDKGYKRFIDLDHTEKVAQYTDEGYIEFVTPKRWIKQHYEGYLECWQPRKGHTIKMTPHHQQPLLYNKSNQVISKSICDIKLAQSNSLILAGRGVGNKDILSYIDRLAIICQADGCIQYERDTYNRWLVSFKKPRKIERFLDIIQKCNIEYTEVHTDRVGVRKFTFSTPKTITKTLNTHFRLDFSYDCAREFINEIKNWDGYIGKGYLYYSSIIKENVDFVSAVATLGGYCAKQTKFVDDRSDKYNDIYRLFLYDKMTRNCQHLQKYRTQEYYNGDVYCVEVPSHKIVVRASGYTIITGNCHMLTIQSWNGLLKLLEEPPEYVILLLCTTNPEKIPGTILSRVQRFNLARISTQGIINRLKHIIDSENNDFMQAQDLSESEIQLRNQLIQENKPYIQYEDSAISYIARLAKGGMRDSITNLEKCLDYSRDLTLDNVHTILSGGVNEQTLLEFLKYTLNKDSKGCLLHFNNIYMSGVDTLLFLKLYIEFLENCIKYIITQDANIVTLADDTLSWVFQNRNFIQEMRYQLLDALKIRNDYSSEDLKIVIESWIIQICNS